MSTEPLNWDGGEEGDENPKNVLKGLANKQLEEMQKKLRNKVVHGQFARYISGSLTNKGDAAHQCRRELEREGTDPKASVQWLREGQLDPETEGIIVAAQDGVTHTRAYCSRILKKPGPTKCRACGKGQETLGHILSACPVHMWTLYKERHDRVLFLLVKAICGSLGICIPATWSRQGGVATPAVLGTKSKKVLVDQVIPTDRPVTECRPDLYVRLAERKRVAIFDVACAWDPIVQVRTPSSPTTKLHYV